MDSVQVEYNFTSIDRTLDFVKPLLIEGDKKVEIKTIFKDSIVKSIDHYLVIITDNEFKYKG